MARTERIERILPIVERLALQGTMRRDIAPIVGLSVKSVSALVAQIDVPLLRAGRPRNDRVLPQCELCREAPAVRLWNLRAACVECGDHGDYWDSLTDEERDRERGMMGRYASEATA